MKLFNKLPLQLAIASTLATSATAIAVEQTADTTAQDIEVISVTGTRRSLRSIAESTVPVDLLTSRDLATSGQLEISQVLAAQLPSFNYPSATLADGTDHAKPAVLRGLAPDHTLVLINGKRRHSGALLNLGGTVGRGSTAVDLNNIPTSAIKRVEILRDGAAAQYGSDAIAGVINIVLKDADEGGSVSYTYGQYDSQMAGSAQLKETIVDSQGKLGFVKGDERRVNDGITRIASANAGFSLSKNGFINISIETRNNEPTNRSGIDEREQYNRDENGALDPKELTFDRYNHRFGKADVEDIALFYNLGYDFNDDLSFYSFASYSNRKGNSGGFYRRAKDNRNVPSVYPDGFLPNIDTDVDDYSFAIGLNGISNDWTWDISTNYGRNDFSLGVSNSINTSMGTNSPTEFDNGALVYEQFLINLDASNSFDLGLPDDVFVTIGTEYRHENYQIKAGELASYLTVLDAQGVPVAAGGAQVLSGFSPDSATDKSRHNIALFAEFDTYLTENWNAVLAGRFEDYSDFGSTFTAKLASRYSITPALSLRGAISSGFRAPSLAQTSYKSVSTVFEDGVPREVGLFPSNEPAAKALGAKDLDAEESVNMTAGFIFTQGNFNFTLDAYRIDINDRIVLSENLEGPAVEAILQQAGELNTQSVRYFTNAIDSRTQGVDIVATYLLGLANYGDLRLSAAVNFNDTEVTHVKDNPPELEALGDGYQYFARREISRFEKGTPADKWNLSATWDYENIQTTLRVTRYGEVVDASSDADGDERLKAKWLTDIEVAYRPTEQWKLALGANNLFDQYPQDTVNNVGYSDFNQIFTYSGFTPYSLDGRFVYANVTFNF
ncbi:TonB-dependent receptor plug domain-containing protein [Pseudoalteromonas arctica]|uniref:TonB-dependent receptor n=1 Tax=Pseudoalteromonas arctica TaxID=394751 RepID=A0A7Y0DUA6_9GAMM|nr:TonB-dependent receptor [Pseudoalteromonas arctica]NMM41749.1 TonB-dependent receptor [Pseudoalteromonas arctica]